LEEATNDKKRWAKDLAKAEEKLKELPNDGNENTRFEKMASLLKTRNKEAKVNQEEIRKLSANLNELQEKLNLMNNKNASMEAKNVRLEKQCDDLLEALEKDEIVETIKRPTNNTPTNNEKKRTVEKQTSKCKKHDKGRCHFGPKCMYVHSSNSVCRSYSKYGFCKEEDECLDRHPEGVCLQWRRSLCDKGLQCFYQHPDREYGSLAKEGLSRGSEETKRKRSQSNESPPPPKSAGAFNKDIEPANSKDHFLSERMFALEKEIENQKRRSSVQMPTQPPVFMMAPNVIPQHQTPTPQPWSTVTACPPPGVSGMMGSMGPFTNVAAQEQHIPGIFQYYQPNH
jgi:hypothetical protein